MTLPGWVGEMAELLEGEVDFLALGDDFSGGGGLGHYELGSWGCNLCGGFGWFWGGLLDADDVEAEGGGSRIGGGERQAGEGRHGKVLGGLSGLCCGRFRGGWWLCNG